MNCTSTLVPCSYEGQGTLVLQFFKIISYPLQDAASTQGFDLDQWRRAGILLYLTLAVISMWPRIFPSSIPSKPEGTTVPQSWHRRWSCRWMSCFLGSTSRTSSSHRRAGCSWGTSCRSLPSTQRSRYLCPLIGTATVLVCWFAGPTSL